MLLLFLFVFFIFCVLVCVCVCSFLFTRDSNIISIRTVEFRYYVANIIPVNLEKPEAIKD